MTEELGTAGAGGDIAAPDAEVIDASAGSWLRRTASALVDFVFPRLCPGCGERVMPEGRLACDGCLGGIVPLVLPLCPTCGAPDSPGKCESCPSRPIYFAAARGAVAFEGFARVLVERLKYDRRPEYASEMVPRMADLFGEEFGKVRFDALVPVPLHRTRQRERGFNQSEELARRLSSTLDIPVAASALQRVRPTPSQTKLGRRARADNIRGAFACLNPPRVRDRQYLLIDDVFTSGATLNECARTLREAGAAGVWALAYARATM